ncbi:hypothetical protein Mpal_1420 [Methanosphaerula palustris E1-9c]|uniref:Uncharacterized protein n=1 Tax=Methanosphaerula palustris (strain ATCC BAA-1556 / DSM 19958 / E1-9c) TaxID=521011 RepID=B8GI09_METPE|nr:hypothetical protein Mpal_1420 [Methanosphaerula palustris E1-9c]
MPERVRVQPRQPDHPVSIVEATEPERGNVDLDHHQISESVAG